MQLDPRTDILGLIDVQPTFMPGGELPVADGDALTTTFGYDADGNRVKLGYPSGNVAQKAFDLDGRPLSAVFGATTVVSAASYLPFGPATQLVFGNGTTKTMTYDSRYRMPENKLTSATAVIADYNCAEDFGGNITQIHDATSAAYNRGARYFTLVARPSCVTSWYDAAPLGQR